ncbi:hypothetical protein [Catenuloplanes atrovinosus]|uniref:Uncharacterized protein n=1 Tax=Catenuloplanes atrovinosus TaxID=137266 RepID=A0AAE3YVC3_9ACTN|nr:hypothetical protein [Catenuloplanes atrovinosus]MDR7279069.1 hypothetical protein [Catenuloplanes atrovinosus]
MTPIVPGAGARRDGTLTALPRGRLGRAAAVGDLGGYTDLKDPVIVAAEEWAAATGRAP